MDKLLMNEPVPSKRPKVAAVIDDDLLDALERWTQDEGRSMSNLCERILRDAAIAAGYLQVSEKAQTKKK